MSSCNLRKKAWSPYVAGIVIGLLQIPAFLLIETAIGTSSSYVTTSGTAASWFDPSILNIKYAAQHVAATAKNWWQVALVVGIVLGAFVSARMSGMKRHAISPAWARSRIGKDGMARYAFAFAAGFLMLIGARLADGCTSGHGLSGIAQLAISSMATIAFLFVGGILAAFLTIKRS